MFTEDSKSLQTLQKYQKEKFCAVTCWSKDINGKSVGDIFQFNPTDSDYLENRYRLSTQKKCYGAKINHLDILNDYTEWCRFVPLSFLRSAVHYSRFYLRK